jgi:lincosamide nucleotidyltransferase A/C/D/E
MVNAKDAIELYKLLSDNNIQIWLSGGWGIDALLGEQTRQHKDLDVLMLLDDVVHMRQILGNHGYQLKELWSENLTSRDSNGNQTETAFVLCNSQGSEFDVHALVIDEQSNGIPAWSEAQDFFFSKQDLAGTGTIAGFTVQCITAESQMLCHAGYQLKDKDLRDLELLHQKFGVPYPDNYTQGSN